MRTSNIANTNRTVFGNRQDRVVVIGTDERRAHALPRPFSKGPAARGFACNQMALKRYVQAIARRAAESLELGSSILAGLHLGWHALRPCRARSATQS